MGNFYNIQVKLQQFIKKYYTNELIKGLILFFSFGLLYFIFTLLVEYFLWLKPAQRRILFYLFVFVELILLIKYIIIPFGKMLGVQKGLTQTEASKLIGRHFPEVDDKLLNVLQLNQNSEQSELLLASIEQKSASLHPIPFQKAIDFKSNIRYLKYLSIPLLIWFFTGITGNNFIFHESLDRVVNYQTAYEPPAPFYFNVVNDKLNAIEGEPFDLLIETVGDIIPQNVEIYFGAENYLLKEENIGLFAYGFSVLTESVTFHLEANGVRSRDYQLEVIKKPTIVGFEMDIDYPAYTGKKDQVIKNTGNTVVPEGSSITWNIKTKETDSLTFLTDVPFQFGLISANFYSYRRRIKERLAYQIVTSNRNLKDYEKLNYVVDVVKDEFPKINIKSDIDSVTRGAVQFVGQISDDYGLKKLELVYYRTETDTIKERHPIAINRTTFDEFYYIFLPEELDTEKGKSYQMYFEVFDNDAINGSKSSKSQIFSYYNKTAQEITDDLLMEQQQNLNQLNKTAKNAEKLSKDFEEFSKKLKNKSDLNWNDKKEFDQFLERQEKYQEMIDRQTDELIDNLDEQELNDEEQSIKDKKEELKKRIEEAKELQKKNELLDELKKMAEKLDKEKMLQKLDKLTEKNKQETRSLERLLELTKRFFVEKKAAQISQKLDSLSERQDKLSESENNNADDQEELNKKFQDIQEDFDALNRQNKELVDPMNFPDTKFDRDVIDEAMKQAQENLNEQKAENDKSNNNEEEDKAKKRAQQLQKAASKKMKQLSKKMQGAMSEMQGEMVNENIDDLRAILENLLTFSFDQEQLMLSFGGTDANNADFPIKLKKQQILKEHFEHIDDSLYTLSLRVQQLSAQIQEDLTEVHYNLDKSLENIAENRIMQGMSNQQYTMTSANNLADMLSDLLNSLQNPGMGSGKGKQNTFSLPDIMKKQRGLQQKMKGGIQKGKQQGKGEQMSGEQYQIYQQQNELRKALKEMLQEGGNKGSHGQKVLEQMEELEQQLLEKGFTNEVLQNMLRLEYELLKLEDATLQQGKDNKRKSEMNLSDYPSRVIPSIRNEKLYFKTNEILNREPLPLHNTYKKKVQEYFKQH